MTDYSIPAYVRLERRKRARLVVRGALLIMALIGVMAGIVGMIAGKGN